MNPKIPLTLEVRKMVAVHNDRRTKPESHVLGLDDMDIQVQNEEYLNGLYALMDKRESGSSNEFLKDSSEVKIKLENNSLLKLRSTEAKLIDFITYGIGLRSDDKLDKSGYTKIRSNIIDLLKLLDSNHNQTKILLIKLFMQEKVSVAEILKNFAQLIDVRDIHNKRLQQDINETIKSELTAHVNSSNNRLGRRGAAI